jgi:hypothetical protein
VAITGHRQRPDETSVKGGQDVPRTSTSTARRHDTDELTRQLTGLPYPTTTEELLAVGVRLLLPPRILEQLARLPLHRRFSSPAEVGDGVLATYGTTARRTTARRT